MKCEEDCQENLTFLLLVQIKLNLFVPFRAPEYEVGSVRVSVEVLALGGRGIAPGEAKTCRVYPGVKNHFQKRLWCHAISTKK